MKKYLTFLAASLVSVSAIAEQVSCYSGGHLIYEGNFKAKDVLVTEGMLAVKKPHSTDVIQSDCIISFEDPVHHKKPKN